MQLLDALFARGVKAQPPPDDQRVRDSDGRRKPQFSLLPMAVGATAIPLVLIPVYALTRQWVLLVMTGPITIACALLSWMTYRIWDFGSRQPGTHAYDWRWGTDTAAAAIREQREAAWKAQWAEDLTCTHCGHAVHAGDDPPPIDPDTVKAAAIRDAVVASGDPFADPEDPL